MFVLGRVREHVAAGLPTRLAVQRGVVDTAGVVTSAAAVMVSVFAIFATLSLLEMKTLGVGLAVAILRPRPSRHGLPRRSSSTRWPGGPEPTRTVAW